RGIVADAVLIRHRGNAYSHVAEIRITVAPEYRGRGLGTAIMRELIEIAYDADLEFVLFELIKDLQGDAIQAVEGLSAFPAGTVADVARDIHGHQHDVLFLKLPL